MEALKLILATALMSVALVPRAEACTSFLVSKGASADRSTMITYAADSHNLYGELYFTPGASHLEGELLDIHEWDTGKYLGQIPQAPKTYTVVGNMNEHQLAISETTFGGREELVNPEGKIDYGSLIYVTLQRARTAREAIRVMDELAQEHGYSSSGESFSIADPNEVWLMEMVGKGKDEKGAVWVARRLPEGFVAAHANHARIREFPLNDKRGTLYSKDVIDFARKKGWFDGADKDFSFSATYAPMDYGALRFCEARVWAFFNRIAPKNKIPIDYIKGDQSAEPMPLWIRPDKKLSPRDVMELMRDHFQGTELDMTKDIGAGPYELPYRWRPLTWEHEGKKYFNERATSTQQTGFSFVAQMRSFLPDPIGGVLWFGVDDTAATVYVPMYAGIREPPRSYAVGTADFESFSWDSAFWVFNFVSNYSYLRYKDMIGDVQKVQRQLEGGFLDRQDAIEKTAMEHYKRSPEGARAYLTAYSAEQASKTVARYRELGEFLLWKYLDGNVKDEKGKATHPGYPKHWYKRVVEEKGAHFEYTPLPGEKKEEH